MRYASVCDGIGAVHVAARGLGMSCAWTSEIDPVPAAITHHHFAPPNLGDMLTITEDQALAYGPIDALFGGTPCQSFSVAGLRGGLADPRGNLALRFCQLAALLRPRWVVWENVPGVLSSHGGRDFRCILDALADSGYGLFYRVLDAQFVRVDGYCRAVPQRRKRVILVGHSGGSWQRAAAVLLDRQSLRGDPAPGREAGQVVAGTIEARAGSGGQDDNKAAAGFVQPVAGTLQHNYAEKWGLGNQHVNAGCPNFVINTTLDEGQTPIIAFHPTQDPISSVGVCHAIGTGNQQGCCSAAVLCSLGVRRLTPRECERLQGFPDNFTAITYRGKPLADSPRYKALGNSMAVNVMRWVFRRMAEVDRLATVKETA